ncbi:MAG TPA: thioredoxin domain-containing protein, partial [Acidobacteriaceae bacterium]|nr:thioredoxin domain-containing protein [Acidobacteriaceae bacterium]
SAASVMEAIEQSEAFSGRAGNPGVALVETMVLAALKSVDLKHGGFGGQPKFPHSSVLDLLIDRSSRVSAATVKLTGMGTVPISEAAGRAVAGTLEKMARGGIYDHLAGGFHRYSVDEHWVVPHFEKMAYDNSELLKNYVHAYLTTGNERFADVARDIVRWMDECLSDRERGGFYASQDADFSLEDDGDYFTWTCDEAAEVLTAEELAVVSAYYDIGEIGDMQHNVAKNVLHVKLGLDVVARKAGVSVGEAEALLGTAKEKLYAARMKRPAPYVDKTMYVGWNAMCISAYLAAGRALGMERARKFALKSLDRVLAAAWSAEGLAHVVAYGEAEVAAARVAAGLDDAVFLGCAALDAWEAMGEMRYFRAAVELTEIAVERFYDGEGGGFFDTEKAADGERRLGALATRRKPLQDSPTPAGNPVAAMLLMRVAELTGRLDYAEKAQETLETFAGVAEHFGLYAATYALALQRLVREPVAVCVIGDDAVAAELERAALRRYAVNKSVVRLSKGQLGELPEVLAASLPRLPKVEGSFAVVCSGHTCQPPVRTVEELVGVLGRSL